MRVLAIDTALGRCSACVLKEGDAEPAAIEQIDLERGHAEALVPLLQRVMAAAGGFETLDRVAVTVGPGSFTGLRVGLSAARAIGVATGLPVVGVSTLAATCAPLLGREPGRIVAAALDARHGAVYFHAVGPDGAQLALPAQLSVAQAVALIAPGPVSLAGSGAPLVAQAAWAQGLDAVMVEALPAPDIRWVARLGLVAEPQAAPPRPLYLKAADARPQTHGRLERL